MKTKTGLLSRRPGTIPNSCENHALISTSTRNFIHPSPYFFPIRFFELFRQFRRKSFVQTFTVNKKNSTKKKKYRKLSLFSSFFLTAFLNSSGSDFWRKTHYGFVRHNGHIYADTIKGNFTMQVLKVHISL